MRARPCRHNLPALPTPLIDREHEVAAIRDRLLSRQIRLLTVTGAGGSGKTRIALEVATTLLEAFEDGVRFIDLAPIRDWTLVVSAIARPLGVHDAGGRPLVESLKHYLGHRRVLLVLDNFEHVLPAAIHVAELLETCSELTVLVTSRSALHLRWEHEFNLPPLPVPDLRQPSAPEVLAHNPAVGLFMQRAQAVRAGFRLTADTAQPVAEICVWLDGLPLALELAAAQARALAPAALLARLEHRFETLVGGAQDETPRHQTMRAAIDWSYQLLDEPGRVLFRRLAVFAGGWNLEAAVAVGAGKSLEAGVVIDGLTRLVDQSLVVLEEGPDGDLRYRLLETVREYALEQLVAGQEFDALQRRHAAYFLMFVEQAEPQLTGARQAQCLDRLEREHDNLRAALRWLLDSGEGETAVRLAAAVWQFWWVRGYLSEGQRWLEAALAGSSRATRTRAAALNGLGVLTGLRGDYSRAAECFTASAALCRMLGDSSGLARALCHRAVSAGTLGDWMSGIRLLEQSLGIARTAGDPWATAYALFQLGSAWHVQADEERAASLLDESRMLFDEMGYSRGVAYALVILGDVARSRADVETFDAHAREALSRFRDIRDLWGIVWALLALGLAACLRGQHKQAVRLFGAGETFSESIGAVLLPLQPTVLAAYERSVAAARAALGPTGFAAASRAGRALSLEEAIAEALSTDTARGATIANKGAELSWKSLSRREREVVELLARGLTNREIADRLVVSERTVDAHVEHVRNKLGLRSRAHIAAWAGVHGLGP